MTLRDLALRSRGAQTSRVFNGPSPCPPCSSLEAAQAPLETAVYVLYQVFEDLQLLATVTGHTSTYSSCLISVPRELSGQVCAFSS